ncbi:MAG: hypothetical protein O9972_22795 [Burkholderiales bacterium]|nr:hypothetical protein [Burkholderiales bacterium]
MLLHRPLDRALLGRQSLRVVPRLLLPLLAGRLFDRLPLRNLRIRPPRRLRCGLRCALGEFCRTLRVQGV